MFAFAIDAELHILLSDGYPPCAFGYLEYITKLCLNIEQRRIRL